MKGFSKLTLGLLLMATVVACPQAGAQAFGLSVTPSANSVLVGNSLTYTISVTNLTALTFPDVWVTNAFTAPIQYIAATASQTIPTLQTNATTVWFDLGAVSPGIVRADLTVKPNTTGSLTNTVIVTDTTTNTASTNVAVNVTNVVPAQADLGVTMTGPKQAVITNDWMTYGVRVTNAGPNAASSVLLTNIVPAGVSGISSPIQNSGTNLISLGTLPNGGSTNLFFTVEPTNGGGLLFTASVGSGTSDTNTANNSASTNIPVTAYLPGALVAVTNSAQSTNFVLGLLEQSIAVTNAGTNAVPAVRVVVTGLTNHLFNAVGTNNGNPFVYYSAKLPANQNANLLLQYFPRKSFPFTNSQLQAFAVPTPNWTPPPATTGTNIITRIVQLPNGNMLIEWPSTSGKIYTVVYSDNVSFSNAMIAPPSIVAPANDMEWIDYGQPTTVSAPTNSSARFYRVIQNP